MKSLPLMLAFVAAVALPGASRAESIRCGNRLASDGASRAEVLAVCGEPLSKNARTELIVREIDVHGEGHHHHPGRACETRTEVVGTKEIDEWTYNFGPHEFIRTVVFENGRLLRVETGKYGF